MKKRFIPLDGARGIAVVLVLLSHISIKEQSVADFLQFQGIGGVGVYLFFCLSAFLLGLGLFTRELNTQNIQHFYVKRILRILPLYYFVVFSTFLYQSFTGGVNEGYLRVTGGFQGFLEHLFFWRGDGVFWSIVIEMQFYVVAPLIAVFLVTYKRIALIILSVLAIVNAIIYVSHYMDFPLQVDLLPYISPHYTPNGTFIDLFITGFFAAYLCVFHKDLLEKYRRLISVSSTILFVTLLILVFILVSQSFLIFNRPFYNFRYLSIIYGVVFSYFIMSVYIGNQINDLLSLRPLCFIGRIGYSVYLLHLFVIQVVSLIPVVSSIQFFISISLIIMISTISYHLIEKPSIELSYFINNRFLTVNKLS